MPPITTSNTVSSVTVETDDKAPATPKTAQRYKLMLAYDGTGFHGWQKQWATSPPHEPLRTVAGVVEDTLRRVLNQPIKLVGASRTDAGVHAKGQVAHLDADTPIPLDRLALAINSRLPEDVEVLDVQVVTPDFNAISGAVTKQYRYRIFNSPHRPLQIRHSVWHCWVPLDLDQMNQAAAKLVGTHDFAGLAAADHGRTSTVRTIRNCLVTSEPPEVHVVVEGTGFLYNMVRIIVGTLVEIGRGRLAPEQIDLILQSRDRRLAGPTLAPHGLCLEWIKY